MCYKSQKIQQFYIKRVMQKRKQEQIARVNVGSIHDSEDQNHCGYCDQQKGTSWGFRSNKLPAGYYETLMNRGWRRCGKYYYKMNMQTTCCPCFTIKSDINSFKIKKQQKKVIKNIVSLFANKSCVKSKKQEDLKHKQKKPVDTQNTNKKQNKQKQIITLSQQETKQLTRIIGEVHQHLSSNPSKIYELLEQKPSSQFNFNILEGLRFFKSQKQKDGHQKGNYSTNYIMLLFGKNKKLFKNLTLNQFVNQVSELVRETLFKVSEKYSYSVEYSGYLILKDDKRPTKNISEEFQVIPKAPLIVEPPLTMNKTTSQQFTQIRQSPTKADIKNKISTQKQNLEVQEQKVEWPQIIFTSQKIIFGKLEILIVPVEQNIQSLNMYTKYSKKIHDKDRESMSGYARFLCQDALSRQSTVKDIKEIKYHPSWDQNGKYQFPIVAAGKVRKNTGCFHMKYYLGEKLIGIGVIDVVEQGLSSVYFFYDHTYKEYRLGVFSTLIEIEYMRYVNKAFPQFKNYYLGFYIHDCQKMNYKADYQPCQLLCPVSYNYITVTKQIREKLDLIVKKKAKVRLSPETEKINSDMVIKGDIGQLIDKNLKLSYLGKKVSIRDFDMRSFNQILINLKIFVQEAGVDIFLQTQFEI